MISRDSLLIRPIRTISNTFSRSSRRHPFNRISSNFIPLDYYSVGSLKLQTRNMQSPLQTLNHHVAASRVPYGEQENTCEYDSRSQPDTDVALDDEQFARIAILQAFSCVSDCATIRATESLRRQSGSIFNFDNEFKADDKVNHYSRSHALFSQAAQYTGVLG